eukprot:TRINITY_DN5248_c0_g1_i1.p7 TRINITY_DN5248_c0_g1~~TRINITY_DN5248_c0_g1_i1.p7  ORF type:complete len:105 (-),score=0.85 TRINITY_DN5248_c0_g1_i1:277-591(-)
MMIVPVIAIDPEQKVMLTLIIVLLPAKSAIVYKYCVPIPRFGIQPSDFRFQFSICIVKSNFSLKTQKLSGFSHQQCIFCTLLQFLHVCILALPYDECQLLMRGG